MRVLRTAIRAANSAHFSLFFRIPESLIEDETWWHMDSPGGSIYPPTPPATPPSNAQCSASLIFACEICGKSYSSRSKLAEHRNYRHSEARPHRCSQCSKVFKSPSNLKQHIKCAHERPRFACPDCPPSESAKVFSESGLRYHRLSAHAQNTG